MHIASAVEQTLKLMRQEKWSDALTVLHGILTARPEDATIIFLMGTCHRMLGHDGMAYTLLLKSMELREDYLDAMVNLAGLLREMGKHKEEVAIWDACKKIAPDEPRVLHNIAGCYLNNGTPEIAEKYARTYIKKFGSTPDTIIQLGLALLEQEKFGEGFDAWDEALTAGRGLRKTRNFQALGQTPTWDGTPGLNVVVYGEQGHGDEIMFASCMGQVMERCNQVFIDTSKADLAPLYERSFPRAIVMVTPDSQLHTRHTELKIDAMIPFGSLPTLFRREKSDFPAHDGYIEPHAAKCREMRRRLDDLGEGLKIGIAWRGGVKQTHAVYRNIRLDTFMPILKQDAHFISVQYTPDAANEAAAQQDTTGVPVHHWQGAIDDFDMLTSLIHEVDLLISVPQTAVHQRAAMGKEVWVPTPSRPPWTFGQSGETSIWYPNQARLFRQKKSEEGWTPAILRVAAALSERTGSKVGPVFIPPDVSSEIQLRAQP